jgi:hypothetical protein
MTNLLGLRVDEPEDGGEDGGKQAGFVAKGRKTGQNGSRMLPPPWGAAVARVLGGNPQAA